MKTRTHIIADEVPAEFWQAEGYQEMLIEGCVFTNGIVKIGGMPEHEIEAMIEEEENRVQAMYEDFKRQQLEETIAELAYADYCAARVAGYAYV